jgi:polynucleotide 5'-hydroxyl-kinase GRC3/NOL9
VCGAFSLEVIEGGVSILGAQINERVSEDRSAPSESRFTVYAPRSHSLPIIRGLRNHKKKPGKSIIELVPNDGAASYSNIDYICPFAKNLFEPPDTFDAIYSHDKTFHILVDAPVLVPRTIYPSSWTHFTKSISPISNPKIFVCGAKGAGKSTFCQFIINSLHHEKNITYLETDPGQPSFTPPGLISLFNSSSEPILYPPFISSANSFKKLSRCHHIGNISPRDNPSYYLNCIDDLISHIPDAESPVIVNTPGWTKGTGLELLISMIERLKPDYIVVIANDTLGLVQSLSPISAETGAKVTLLEPGNENPPVVPLTASELRNLSIMSYFHYAPAEQGTENWNFDRHLTQWKPWIATFQGTSNERGIEAIAIQGEELHLDDITLAINGTIVAIILVSEITDGEVKFTKDGIPVLSGREEKYLNTRVSECVGYAIIRDINVKEGYMLLVTPWDPSALKEGQKLVLERGRVNLPIWGMWDSNKFRIGPWLERIQDNARV